MSSPICSPSPSPRAAFIDPSLAGAVEEVADRLERTDARDAARRADRRATTCSSWALDADGPVHEERRRARRATWCSCSTRRARPRRRRGRCSPTARSCTSTCRRSSRSSCSERDVPLHALPLYHSAQMHCFLMPALAVGATNHLLEAPDLDEIFDRVPRDGIDSLFFPPTVWVGVANHPRLAEADLGGLRKAFYGASIMPVPVLHKLQARLPDAGFFNCFGQSEIGPLATVLRPEEHARAPGFGRPRGPVRGDAGRRRGDARRRRRRGRRGHLPLAAAVRGLLGQARGDRRGVPRRLVSLRRPVPDRRARATCSSSTGSRT